MTSSFLRRLRSKFWRPKRDSIVYFCSLTWICRSPGRKAQETGTTRDSRHKGLETQETRDKREPRNKRLGRLFLFLKLDLSPSGIRGTSGSSHKGFEIQGTRDPRDSRQKGIETQGARSFISVL